MSETAADDLRSADHKAFYKSWLLSPRDQRHINHVAVRRYFSTMAWKKARAIVTAFIPEKKSSICWEPKLSHATTSAQGSCVETSEPKDSLGFCGVTTPSCRTTISQAQRGQSPPSHQGQQEADQGTPPVKRLRHLTCRQCSWNRSSDWLAPGANAEPRRPRPESCSVREEPIQRISVPLLFIWSARPPGSSTGAHGGHADGCHVERHLHRYGASLVRMPGRWVQSLDRFHAASGVLDRIPAMSKRDPGQRLHARCHTLPPKFQRLAAHHLDISGEVPPVPPANTHPPVTCPRKHLVAC